MSEVLFPNLDFVGKFESLASLKFVAKFNDKISLSFFFFKIYSLPTVKDWPPSIVSAPATLFKENILLKSILLSKSVRLLDLFGLIRKDAFGVK